jgi:two-component system sensor histidine kinase HydH
MPNRTKPTKFWSAVPPWVLIGSVAVLLPLFAFMTVANINRQKEKSRQMLLEKGAALIRSFEAGTRTGMMNIHWGRFQLQRLLTETARQPDIVYLFVTDINGNIVAHNDLVEVGRWLESGLNLEKIARSTTLHWRQVARPNGSRVFEIYGRFEPVGRRGHMAMGMERMPGSMMMGRRFPPETRRKQMPADQEQIIFVGLDMSAIEQAQRADVRHAIIMGTILLLVGFAGITLLFMAQSYRATRASLTRIKAFSDNLVENIPIGLVATDSGRKIAAFNQTAESVLRLPAAKIIGRQATEVLPPQLGRRLEDINAPEPLVAVEIDCPLDDGTTVPLEISTSRLKDEAGTYLGSVLLFKDLTEVRALRKEIARNQRLASVGRLAAGVAHEIRNPLSSIKGFATYFLQRYKDIPQDQQTAGIMIQEVDRLNRVVGQLLEFARPVALSPKPTSLKNLIDRSLKLIGDRAAEKSIRLVASIAPTADEVLIDPDRINQVLLNLYLNAIEAMQTGGKLTVSAAIRPESGQLEIHVDDTGDGIRAENLSKIFDPYFTTKSSGTGLGLAIAYNVMDAMGGALRVQSRPGHGTRFTLAVPAAGKDYLHA